MQDAIWSGSEESLENFYRAVHQNNLVALQQVWHSMREQQKRNALYELFLKRIQTEQNQVKPIIEIVSPETIDYLMQGIVEDFPSAEIAAILKSMVSLQALYHALKNPQWLVVLQKICQGLAVIDKSDLLMELKGVREKALSQALHEVKTPEWLARFSQADTEALWHVLSPIICEAMKEGVQPALKRLLELLKHKEQTSSITTQIAAISNLLIALHSESEEQKHFANQLNTYVCHNGFRAWQELLDTALNQTDADIFEYIKQHISQWMMDGAELVFSAEVNQRLSV